MAMLTRAERDAKANRTNQAANEIISRQQEASAAKTARLRALRERHASLPDENGPAAGEAGK